MSKVIWIIFIAAVAGGYLFWRGASKAPQPRVPAAETPAAPAPSAVKEINMDAGYFFFRPGALTLKKGEPVRLIVSTTGTHTFTIDELGVNTALRDSQAIVEFTPNKTGTFTYYCAVPGHRQNGQFGTLTVTD